MPRVKQVARKCTKAKFASLDAETRFQVIYSDKKFLADLGFVSTGEDSYPLPAECRTMMQSLGWNKFSNQRINPDISIVREFYSNIWPNNIYSMFVRERQVPLNPKIINQLFDLQYFNNDADDYHSLSLNLTDEVRDQALKDVTIPGTQWTCSQHGNKTCRGEFLTDEAKVWFYFIRHSVMPTTHTSTINVDKILLLSCILKGKTINVGKIICDQIRACAKRKTGEMYFPTLICLLCKASGVMVAIDDGDFYARGTISAHDLSRILPATSAQPSRPNTRTQSARKSTVPQSSTASDAPAINMQQLHTQLQVYWRYIRDWDAAVFRSLLEQMQQTGEPWPTFLDQLVPDDRTMGSNEDI